MHVAHVLHSLDVGGTENGVVNLIKAMPPDVRHSVVSMTSAGPLAARLPAGVAVHSVGKRAGVDLAAVARLAALLRKLGPDIVHSRNWAAFDAVPAARLAGVRAVIHGEHGREITDPHGRNPRRNRLRRLFAGLVMRFVAVSHDLQRWLVDDVGIPEHKVVTIHNGVDAHRFSPDGREEARAHLGAAPDAVVFGTVGRLDPVKDQASFLAAFAIVAREHPTAAAVIVGAGPCSTALEAQIRALGIDGRARILGRRLDVAALMSGFDVFALPSIAEGMSNTILEAMAAGLPVVATRVGGSPEMVQDGVTGLLVPPRDPPCLAGALASYLADPHLRTLHGKAGRQRAVEEFSVERMADAYRALYLSVSGRAKERA